MWEVTLFAHFGCCVSGASFEGDVYFCTLVQLHPMHMPAIRDPIIFIYFPPSSRPRPEYPRETSFEVDRFVYAVILGVFGGAGSLLCEVMGSLI